jgi:methylglutaconyl-CoA hydratase
VPTNSSIQVEKKYLSDGQGYISFIELNRPNRANALNEDLVDSMLKALRQVEEDNLCRAVVLKGAGKNFCAGADLTWMSSSAVADKKDNIGDAKKLQSLFQTIVNLSKPSICRVHGAAFGGALGLVACCDIVFASSDSLFCLSELKLGLVPATILPFLMRRMNFSAIRRLSLTAKKIPVERAKTYGLVDEVADNKKIDEVILQELNCLLSVGPESIKVFKKLHDKLILDDVSINSLTTEVLAQVRAGSEAKEGLDCFFTKKNPSWVKKI